MTTPPALRPPRSAWRRLVAGLALATTASAALLTLGVSPATADDSATTLTINGTGGTATDGSDGLRIVVNSYGQDQVRYRGAPQYCCSAAAPMLNIGGELFGTAGPAYDNAWSSLTYTSTSGSASTTGTGTGSGSATVHYVATVGGLDYVLDRTLTYTAPNDFFTDQYTVTIPAGNTADVRLYQGGDTAPGGSDTGYGVMLTNPVRSVISLNPYSNVLLGYREIPGQAPFDGATSQDFYVPYDAVEAGEDIGFTAEASNHDAGLMVQWNLGSTPGTTTRALETFVNPQGTNLTAAFRQATAVAGAGAVLDLGLANTVLSTVDGLGYTFALPAGMVVGAGAPTNTCGGTLTAAAGSTTVTLVAGSVAAASNCLVSLPVVASAAGSYTIEPTLLTGTTGALESAIATTTLTVTPAPTAPAPGTPQGVTTTADQSQVQVSWTAPTSGGPVDHYVVTLQPSGQTCTTAELRCLFGGVAGQSYTATVVAVSAAGSNGAAGTGTTSAPVAPPTVPTSAPVTPLTLTTDRGAITQIAPGQTITVVGTGFLPFSTATITVYSTPVVLGTVVTDAAGNFSKQVVLPADLPAGTHSLVASGVAPDGTQRFLRMDAVVPSPTSAGPVTRPELASTGFDVALPLALGVGAVLVGAITMRSARRRAR